MLFICLRWINLEMSHVILFSLLLTSNLFLPSDNLGICFVLGNTKSLLFTGGSHSSRRCGIHGWWFCVARGWKGEGGQPGNFINRLICHQFCGPFSIDCDDNGDDDDSDYGDANNQLAVYLIVVRFLLFPNIITIIFGLLSYNLKIAVTLQYLREIHHTKIKKL